MQWFYRILRNLRGDFFDPSATEWLPDDEEYLRGMEPFGSKAVTDFKGSFCDFMLRVAGNFELKEIRRAKV